MIQFTVYAKPQPKGSTRSFVRNGRAITTSDNAKLKPFAKEVSRCAIQAVVQHADDIPWDCAPLYGPHVPVTLDLVFTFLKPKSAKNRVAHVVKPDLDKICRSVLDSLTGIIYEDDAQVVEIKAFKRYGEVESVQVTAEEVV